MQIARAEIPCGALNRFLYTEIGRNWSWTDRLVWTTEQWQKYAESTEIETWIGHVRGTPAGYFELANQVEPETSVSTAVEIAYFGLMPGFIGHGLGGRLLEAAIRRAWEMGTSRVWVHTCTLDGPYALANYVARGLRVYRVEKETEGTTITRPITCT
jgi:GNAT superfamily N-acetyltransferase